MAGTRDKICLVRLRARVRTRTRAKVWGQWTMGTEKSISILFLSWIEEARQLV